MRFGEEMNKIREFEDLRERGAVTRKGRVLQSEGSAKTLILIDKDTL